MTPRKDADQPATLGDLTRATENLASQTKNLEGTIAKVQELEKGQQTITQNQQEIEKKVVLKNAFDERWAETGERFEHMAQSGRRWGIGAVVALVVLFGTIVGVYVSHQQSVNNKTHLSQVAQDKLNRQRTATCETKNAGLQQGVAAFSHFIAQEKALAHPDVVVIEVLQLVKFSTQAQILPCPGTTESPTPPAGAPSNNPFLPPTTAAESDQ